ncbi:putative two-component response regulator [Limnospira indica PCC 8005]|uniref:Two-component response regulator n=2 Tax=Sirenicapillariaceae TaxID=2934961 RepID=A0A9P1KKL9_9CYAN|nr:putative two-component response regulator [Limnospira indica PCC 8005]
MRSGIKIRNSKGKQMTTKRILLIDDEDDIREIAQLSLEMIGGWNVITACCGMEGIETAENEQPDAIMLDVMMPELDGFATFQKLQANQQTKDIPVILLTAKIQSSDRQKFDSLGVSGVIAKPFEPLSLAEEVAQILGWT